LFIAYSGDEYTPPQLDLLSEPAQGETPPPAYFDISAPFDFLAAYATLEQVIAAGKYSAEQLHT
jgi:hypothetical protein